MENAHHYDTDIHWAGSYGGVLSSPLLPLQIEVAIPDDFPNGVKGIWTPEHLLLAAVNACLMVTFISIAANSKVSFIRYESNAKGIVEKIANKLMFSSITIVPKIVIATGQNEDKIIRLLEMSEKACAISNSMLTKINVEPLVTFETLSLDYANK